MIPKGTTGPGPYPNAIETESMAIIESLLPADLPFSEKEKVVVKRIVHAMGDPQIASAIGFHPQAIDSGLKAIHSGCPIFTDVKMVKAGISERLAVSFGCEVQCALSGVATEHQVRKGATRSATAFNNLNTRLNDAVIAIGNAPTALLALVELMDKGLKPALVVGMPVGFVQAAESKAALSQRNIPYITINGRRGGSPAAAATINALLRLAGE